MPVAFLKVSKRLNAEVPLSSMSTRLREWVAAALNCAEGPVSEQEIEIMVRVLDPINEPHNSDFMVIIIAHDYDERKAEVDQRVDLLRRHLRVYIDNCAPGNKFTGGVWILLAPSGYAKL